MRIKYDLETDTLSITLKDEQVAESEYIERKGIVSDTLSEKLSCQHPVNLP